MMDTEHRCSDCRCEQEDAPAQSSVWADIRKIGFIVGILALALLWQLVHG